MSRALLIVDHGSRRAEAHTHLEWVAREVQELVEDLQVYIAHMELAEPSIPQAVASCVADGATELIVHPLFLLPGRHLSEQIPRLVESAVSRYPQLSYEITPPVGSAPGLAELVLATVRH